MFDQPSTPNVTVLPPGNSTQAIDLDPYAATLCDFLESSYRLLSANINIAGWRHQGLHLIQHEVQPSALLHELSRRTITTQIAVSATNWFIESTPTEIAKAFNNASHSEPIILLVEGTHGLTDADGQMSEYRRIVCAQLDMLFSKSARLHGWGFTPRSIAQLRRTLIIATCADEKTLEQLPKCFSQFLRNRLTAPTISHVENRFRRLGAAMRVNQSSGFDPVQLAQAATNSEDTERWIDEWMLKQLIEKPSLAQEYSQPDAHDRSVPTENHVFFVGPDIETENPARTLGEARKRVESRHSEAIHLIRYMDSDATNITRQLADIPQLHSVVLSADPPLGYTIRINGANKTVSIGLSVDIERREYAIRLLTHGADGEITASYPATTASMALRETKRLLGTQT